MGLLDFFKDDQVVAGDLGRGYWDAVKSDEKFPGISPSGYPDDVPDPDVPAVPAPEESIFSLLREIRDRLPTDRVGNKVMMTLVQTLGTAAGEKTFAHKPQWRYFYISNPTARAINVYLGVGRVLFLGTIPAGRTMRGEMPFPQDDLTITWDAGASSTEQITVILSSGKIDVSVI